MTLDPGVVGSATVAICSEARELEYLEELELPVSATPSSTLLTCVCGMEFGIVEWNLGLVMNQLKN